VRAGGAFAVGCCRGLALAVSVEVDAAVGEWPEPCGAHASGSGDGQQDCVSVAEHPYAGQAGAAGSGAALYLDDEFVGALVGRNRVSGRRVQPERVQAPAGGVR
jgi:hypothetical protein